MMRLEARVEKLEAGNVALARRHVILTTGSGSDLDAIEAYGRDRILEGEKVELIALVPLTASDASGWSGGQG